MTWSPPQPPPQAIRVFVKQIFGLRAAGPRVSATVLDEPGIHVAAIEFLNEGDEADGVRCLIRSDAGSQELSVGNLAPGASTTVQLHHPVGESLNCVWTALDAQGRLHLWNYEGKHKRLRRGRKVDLPTALEQMYPD
jgi:hypothetical protein